MIKWFAAFFAFGTAMCTLTILLLVFPGTKLDAAWRLNLDAEVAFQSIGKAAILIMFVVGTACAAAAIGLWRKRVWGIRVALSILSANIIGDLLNALVRHDWKALVGEGIGGAMFFYLARYPTAR
jgi:hypothetical protein